MTALTVDDIATMANRISGEAQAAFEDVILPLAKAACTAVSMMKATSLKSVGGQTSSLEMTEKSVALTGAVVLKYLAAVVAAINVVVLAQQRKELDRDKYTADLTMDDLKPYIETALTDHLKKIDFGQPTGLMGEFLKQVKNLGTGQFVDIILGLL